MGEEGKKISFGFSKLIKKTQIVSSTLNQPKTEINNVELIDCFEEKSIKLKNPVQPKEKVLIIPLPRRQDNITDNNTKGDPVCLTSPPSSVNETNIIVKSELSSTDTIKNTSDVVASESKTTSALTLDEIAAKEILQDLNNKKDEDECRVFSVPLTNNPPSGENESTLDDYDNIPVGDFGLAMLRGMGWCPGKGIGKSEKLVTPSLPTLRPKGMGLGADKVIKSSNEPRVGNEDLKMVKNSWVRVLAGQYKSLYGQIEGFDDETGRLIVKLALKNVSVSLNEFMVQLVDKGEFLKNSKVINVSKYEQYKDEENKGKSNQSREDDPKINVPKMPAEELPKLVEESHKVKSSSFEKDHVHMATDKKTSEKFSRQLTKHPTKRRSRSRSSSLSRGSEFKERNSSSKNKFESKKHAPKTLESKKETKHRSSKRSSSSSSSTSPEDGYRQKKKLSKSAYKHWDGDKMSSQKKKYVSEKRPRSSSSSSSSTASSDYKKKRDFRTYKKKSSSKKSKGRSRSRSPRKHSSSKKHRNKHRDRS